MSAFHRLPPAYLGLCNRIAAAQPPRLLAVRRIKISPQNRRVRFAADLYLANQKSFPNRVTRQQRRFTERNRPKPAKR